MTGFLCLFLPCIDFLFRISAKGKGKGCTRITIAKGHGGAM